MKKFSMTEIEAFSTSASQKSWLKKYYNLINDHNLWSETQDQIISRMAIGMKKTTAQAMKSTFLKFCNNYEITDFKESPKIRKSEPLISEIPKTPEELEAEALRLKKIAEALRAKQEEAKKRALELEEIQRKARLEKERLEAIEKAEIEAKKRAEIIRLEKLAKERREALRAGFISQDIPEEYIGFNPEDFKVFFASEFYQQKNEKDRFYSLLDSGKNVILSGHAGTGKTELALKYAHDRNIPCYKISCSADMRKTDLIGSKTLDEKQRVKNIAGMLVKGVLSANKTGESIVILDEGNALIPKVQILLYGLTDKTRRIDLPEMSKPLKLNKGAKLNFVITQNDLYSGVSPLNKPLLDRFRFIEMERLPKKLLMKIFESYNVDLETKEKIFELGERLNELQKNNHLGEQALYTTRTQVSTLEDIESYTFDGIEDPIKESIESNIVKKFTEERYRKVIRDEISSIGFY